MGRKSTTGVEYLTTIGGVYYVKVPTGEHYADGSRKHITRRVRTKAEAHKVIAKLQREIAESGPAILDGDKITFNELLSEYNKLYPKHECIIRPIREFFGGRKIKTITHADCRRFIAKREEVPNGKYKDKSKAPLRKATTINREGEVLRAIFRFALANGWITRNPFDTLPGQRPLIDKKQEKPRKRFPSPAEEAALLTVCVPPRAHLRPLVIAALDTGLRRGALLELTWHCVDFQSGLIAVPEGNEYKDRPPYTGMTERLEVALLQLYELSDKHPDTRIFGNNKEFKGAWETACRLAGVEDLRFHDLRHGFVTSLRRAGVDKRTAMKAAGHSSEDIHDDYDQIDKLEALEIAAALDKLHQSRKPEYVN